jgi:hypothetical protein
MPEDFSLTVPVIICKPVSQIHSHNQLLKINFWNRKELRDKKGNNFIKSKI